MSSSMGVYFFSFLLAFCSLFYELVYAEILSVCLGGTKIQYITTISIFTCALGFGSLIFQRFSGEGKLLRTFFRVELLIMLLGGVGPFLITWLLQPGGIEALAKVKIIISYGVVFAIGFLSGFELPSLFALKKNAEGKILAMDYLGMLAASISFPLFFLNQFGVAASTLLVALSNGAALIWISPKRRGLTLEIIYTLVIIALMGTVIHQAPLLNTILSTLYLGGIQ